MDSNLIPYQPVISDIKNLIAAGQNVAYNAANRAMIMTYWNIGKRIVEEEQSGAERAEYGKRLISILSDELTKEFGSNYSGRSLRYYRKFYLCFPDFEIWNTRVPNLNWSHFRALLRVPDEDARVWYMNEAANENWSVRTLDRNIGTQYYYRLLHSPKKEAVIAEMKEKTAAEPKHQFELLKSPIVAEFFRLSHRRFLCRVRFGVCNSFSHPGLPHGNGKGICFRGPAAAYCDRYGRLLHRPCVFTTSN